MLELEELMRKNSDDNIGSPMIFAICDALRECIGEMNEIILDKLAELTDKNSINSGLRKTQKISMDTAPTSFTPVNIQTFSKWCAGYMEKIRMIKEEQLTEVDLKPTGRQLFEMKEKGLGGFTMDIDEGEDSGEEEKIDGEGDESESEEEEGATIYDKNLFAQEEGLQDEDEVDFD